MNQVSDTQVEEEKPPSSIKTRIVLVGVVLFVAFMMIAIFNPELVAAMSGG